MRVRFRLLPAVIFLAGFATVLKLGSAWHALDGLLAAPAVAEEAAAASGAKDAKAGAGHAKGAKDGKGGQPTVAAAPAAKPAGKRGEITGNADGWFDPNTVTNAELDVLQKLSQRRQALDARAKALDVRARLLQATEKRIDSKIAELKQIRDTVSKLLKKHDAEQDRQMKSLVKIYERMKPKDAARIFERLDMAILLDVVERMSENKAAPIMAAMSPAKAKEVTAALAQRGALPKPQSGKP